MLKLVTSFALLASAQAVCLGAADKAACDAAKTDNDKACVWTETAAACGVDFLNMPAIGSYKMMCGCAKTTAEADCKEGCKWTAAGGLCHDPVAEPEKKAECVYQGDEAACTGLSEEKCQWSSVTTSVKFEAGTCDATVGACTACTDATGCSVSLGECTTTYKKDGLYPGSTDSKSGSSSKTKTTANSDAKCTKACPTYAPTSVTYPPTAPTEQTIEIACSAGGTSGVAHVVPSLFAVAGLVFAALRV